MTKKKNLILIIILSILLLLILIALVYVIISPTNEESDLIEENLPILISEDEDTEQQFELPQSIFYILGTVIEKGSDYIMLRTEGFHMEDGSLTQVRVNAIEEGFETVIEGDDSYEIYRPGTLIMDSDNNEINLTSIEIDQNVSVESPSNIRNMTEIHASSIRILSQTQE